MHSGLDGLAPGTYGKEKDPHLGAGPSHQKLKKIIGA